MIGILSLKKKYVRLHICIFETFQLLNILGLQ